MSLPDSHCFVRLTEGECHFRLDGPVDAPLLLLIHGATVPEWEFDLIRPYLLAGGFRTLSFDLYGHGYSDRPAGSYSLDRYRRQALELLDEVAGPGPVNVLGHSLGAAVAAAMAIAAPGRIQQLALAAPLVDFVANLPVARLLQAPVLGEVLARHYLVPMLVRRRRKRYRNLGDGSFGARYRQQLLKPGFDRAMLGLLRDGALGDQRLLYKRLAEMDHAVHLLWGSGDEILPAAQRSVLRRALGQASVFEVAEAGHSFLLTHPGIAAPSLLKFFESGGGIHD